MNSIAYEEKMIKCMTVLVFTVTQHILYSCLHDHRIVIATTQRFSGYQEWQQWTNMKHMIKFYASGKKKANESKNSWKTTQKQTHTIAELCHFSFFERNSFVFSSASFVLSHFKSSSRSIQF